jgi:predicted dehydrogenase
VWYLAAPMRSSIVRVGVIGVGGFGGGGHMRAYAESPYAQVVAVCDLSPERARQIAGQFGVEAAFDDYRDLLALAEVDAVDVATPNDMHCQITLAALAAGKHVLCEKPLALSVEDARRMERAAVEAGLGAKVNFIHRFVPAARYVKQLLDEGALGRIFHCNITYAQGHLTDPTAPRAWRMHKAVTGTGVLGDLGTHAVDLARHWMGTEFTAVSGRLTTFTRERPLPGATGSSIPLLPVDVDDEATWLASFANGAEGSFFTSRNATGHANHIRAELYGSAGGLIYDNAIRDSVQASLGDAMWKRGAWATLSVPSSLMRDQGKSSLHYWIEDLVLGSRMAPTFHDGVRAQEVVDAVVRSAEARRWVEVELGAPVGTAAPA